MKKNKMPIAITIFLLFAMTISLIAIPATTAQETPTWETYAYIGATPNPVGVGQETLLHVGITMALQSMEMGWDDLSITITKPDGTTETIRDVRTDSTGGTGRIYVPTMPGNYTLQGHFPEQATTATNRAGDMFSGFVPVGTVMLASNSEQLTLVVQEEPVPYYQADPLPTEYWTRPINAQHRDWYRLAGSSWMSTEYNEGIESPHILWTKPIGQAGGLMGGEHEEFAFDCGDAYVGKFSGRELVAGLLIYNKFEPRVPTEFQEVVAVDARTGEEVWSKLLIGKTGTTTGRTVPAAQIGPEGVTDRFPDGTPRRVSMSQTYMWDSFNLHGGYAFIWTTVGSTWMAFDAFTGDWRYTITNVPSGTTERGYNGELLRRTQNLAQGWMALWNSTKMGTPWETGMSAGSWNPHGNVYNASGTGALVEAAWEWNITITTGLTGSVRAHELGERVVGGSLNQTHVVNWAFSMKPGEEGRLLYNKAWTAPASWAGGNQSLGWSTHIEENVGFVWSKEERQHYAFSLETGEYLWTQAERQHYLDIFGAGRTAQYGMLYSRGYGGVVYAHDLKTGDLVWKYEAIDPLQEILWGPNWPMFFAAIYDGKIYLYHYEHSPVDPKPRGAPFICLDAETGQEIFRVDGLLRGSNWGGAPIVGDSVLIMLNTYDQNIYAVGKGPSATTISASPKISTHGNTVLVEGTVTDISPGTENVELQKRFPNGVPAVADESMGDWMKYVYQHFARPTDAAGVEVIVSVLDPNNNYYEVGRTTGDSDGFFRLSFEPEVPGEYTIVATFEGSKSYYGSHAKTAINVQEAPVAPPEPTPPPESIADAYFVPAIVGLLIAIIAVGALMVLMLRKQ